MDRAQSEELQRQATELDDAHGAINAKLGDARAAAKAEFDGAIADLHETITGPVDGRTADRPDPALNKLKAELKAELRAEVKAEAEAEAAKKIADLEAAHAQEIADLKAEHAQETGELRSGIADLNGRIAELEDKNQADKAAFEAKFDDVSARLRSLEDARGKPDAPESASDAPSEKAGRIDARTNDGGFWSEMANGPKSARKWYSDETLAVASTSVGGVLGQVAEYVPAIDHSVGMFATALGIGTAALAYVRKWRRESDAHRPDR